MGESADSSSSSSSSGGGGGVGSRTSSNSKSSNSDSDSDSGSTSKEVDTEPVEEEPSEQQKALDELTAVLQQLPTGEMDMEELQQADELLNLALNQVHESLEAHRREVARQLATDPTTIGDVEEEMVLPRQLMRVFLESRIDFIGRPAK